MGQHTSTCSNSRSLRICHALVASAGTHRHVCTYTQTNTDLYIQIHFKIFKTKYSTELEILRDPSSSKRGSWLRFDSSRARSCRPSYSGSLCRDALDAGYPHEHHKSKCRRLRPLLTACCSVRMWGRLLWKQGFAAFDYSKHYKISTAGRQEP